MNEVREKPIDMFNRLCEEQGISYSIVSESRNHVGNLMQRIMTSTGRIGYIEHFTSRNGGPDGQFDIYLSSMDNTVQSAVDQLK